jgi:phage terminase large subunit-like protein
MLDDVEGALVKQAWIDRARRPAPGRGGGGHGNAPPYARMVLAIDPAVTGRKSSDTTGIVLGGLGYDGQMYVIADYTAKMTPEAWAAKALDVYTEQGCDLIVVETNKGGEGIAAILRLTAQQRGLQCVTVGKDEKPRHNPRVVSLKERFARGAKEDRAQPAAVAYEAGRISHVEGSDLEALESTLTTWQPAPDAVSPGDLDALAHLANELLDLVLDKPDARTGFQGILAAQRQITAPARPSSVPRADVAAQFKAILASGPNRRRI